MPDPAPKSITARSLETDRNAGDDAICFVAGLQGIHFSAGVVHAYLAADREAPVAVAGISGGALTSAAMYKAYHELKKHQSESAAMREAIRWSWFRTYVERLTVAPLDPFWDAIPNPVDFFAETTPVEDLSCPPDLKRDETEARTQYHRLIRLGNWMSGLTVTVGDVADLIVRRVRWKERYGGWILQAAVCLARGLWIGLQVAIHLALDPRIAYFPLRYQQGKVVRTFRPAPLFGYKTWLLACAWLAVLMASLAVLCFGKWLLGSLLLVGVVLTPAFGMFYRRDWRGPFLKPLGIEKGLLHKYHLKRWLLDMFGDLVIEAPSQKDGGSKAPFHVLIVAAVVNRIDTLHNAQLWARPNKGVRLCDAVMAALAKPGLFPPEQPEDPHHWLSQKAVEGLNGDKLTLIDGHVIGSNPLPAFFSWVRKQWGKGKYRDEIKKLISSESNPSAALRIVYSVPIEPLSREHEVARESLNIIENGLTSITLERRRDTEMESLQTQFISGLEAEIRKKGSSPAREVRLPIFPLPISPEKDISYANVLDPQRKEGLQHIAAGCRRTLESIYRERLSTFFASKREVECSQLLRVVARDGGRAGFISAEMPGMMEVCSECTKCLRVRPVESSEIDRSVHSYGVNRPPHEYLPHLANEDRPRVVFLANGGVFRGSFHIGVAAALRAAGVKPDMVVGSSVGAIVGAAISSMSRIPADDQAYEYLARLTQVFLHCDQKVALTRTLKNAAKQLGVRGRSISISPRQIRAIVRKGSAGDASYALSGAPPALTDALSDLFLLPHTVTLLIAARFVSGHITEAIKLFAKELQKETLQRLSIETCVMGSDLIEKTAAELLFPKEANFERFDTQPYLSGNPEDPGTAFFATATHLNRRATILLGRDFPVEVPAPARYDFLEGCLSSSAFPVVFAPRAVSCLFPGRGRTNILLCDGGIFDNLPFFPAIRVLSELQESRGKNEPGGAYERLRKRQKKPALLIAAGLECNPHRNGELPSDVVEMYALASALSNNVKIGSFERTSDLVYRMTGRLLDAYRDQPEAIDACFADSIVPAAVLKIIPEDREHLNGTFEFCRATGLDRDKMRRSIAHGCFQTMSAFSAETKEGSVLEKALSGCAERFRPIRRVASAAKERMNPGECPHFTIEGKGFACPFHGAKDGEVKAVYDSCVADPVHLLRQASA